MRTCPYCTIPFSTKQRLVSHLTKTKKCYNIQSIGMPPILLELMGYISNPNTLSSTPVVKPQSNAKAHTSKKIIPPVDEYKKDISNEMETNNESDTNNENKNTQWQCVDCHKYYINQKNLERHISNQKCPKNKRLKLNIDETESFVNIDDSKSIGKQSKEKLDTEAIIPLDEPNDIDENNRETRNMFDVYLPKQRSDILPGRSKRGNKVNTPKAPIKDNVVGNNNVRFIVKEDYTNYLINLTGSEMEAHKLLKSAISGKERGAIDLLYKIYCDGRNKSSYPVEIIDLKNKIVRYKTPNGDILDESFAHIKAVLIDNLIGTYLKHNNYVIAKISNSLSSGNSDDDQDHGDVGNVQTYILSLSTDKIKDKIILGFLTSINKKK